MAYATSSKPLRSSLDALWSKNPSFSFRKSWKEKLNSTVIYISVSVLLSRSYYVRVEEGLLLNDMVSYGQAFKT